MTRHILRRHEHATYCGAPVTPNDRRAASLRNPRPETCVDCVTAAEIEAA